MRSVSQNQTPWRRRNNRVIVGNVWTLLPQSSDVHAGYWCATSPCRKRLAVGANSLCWAHVYCQLILDLFARCFDAFGKFL